ncbi:MAG: RpoL/Rpb11 RNA polymerase subunit family protein [Candidatus Hodarchaeota archaeon]
METRVVRKEESLLEFEIVGEDHTFLSALREALKDQPGVLFAAYRSPHPLLESPIFYLRTKDLNPLEALQNAADDTIKQCDDLIEIFNQKLLDLK